MKAVSPAPIQGRPILSCLFSVYGIYEFTEQQVHSMFISQLHHGVVKKYTCVGPVSIQTAVQEAGTHSELLRSGEKTTKGRGTSLEAQSIPALVIRISWTSVTTFFAFTIQKPSFYNQHCSLNKHTTFSFPESRPRGPAIIT